MFGGSASWNIEQVPARIEKLIADKQFYAAIQVYLHSSMMLEREGLQTVICLLPRLTIAGKAILWKYCHSSHSFIKLICRTVLL